MGYNLIIGNAAVRYDPDDLRIGLSAEAMTHPDAPDHDSFVGKGNVRSPSYTVWADFCREAGIYELFYGQGWNRNLRGYKQCSEDFHRETPLLCEHPGVQPISKADLEYVRAARIRREKSNGGKPPGFSEDTDSTLVRLLWLEFWMAWALDNCTIPIIENS